EGAGEGEDAPGHQPRGDERQRHPGQPTPRSGAERGGRLLVVPAEPPDRSLEGEDEEGERDEGLREDDRGGRVGDRDPRGLEVLAEQTPSPEGREQCQAADDRREDEGDEDEGAEGGLPGPARPGEEERQRRAEEDAQEGRDRRRAQREQQRGDRGLRAQERPELPDVDRADQAEQRDDDDQDGTGRRKPQPAWWGHG